MDFSLDYSESQEKFAREVRKWIKQNIPKDFKAPCDPVKVTREEWLWRRELAVKLARKGWLYPEYPPEYGGGGLDAEKSFVLYEEFSEIGLSLPPYYDTAILAIPAILGFGTEEQKKRFLPPILKGEINTWQLFTEPEAGSDEANQQTNALRSTREKDYFIVNGGKIFVGGVHTPPDQFWTLTRSDTKAPRHQNLATFLIPADLPGITITPLDLFDPGDFNIVSGRTPSSAHGAKHQVFFDDVKVHESYLIGGERDGWRVVNMSLALEHSGGMGAVMRGRPRNLVAESDPIATAHTQMPKPVSPLQLGVRPLDPRPHSIPFPELSACLSPPAAFDIHFDEVNLQYIYPQFAAEFHRATGA